MRIAGLAWCIDRQLCCHGLTHNNGTGLAQASDSGCIIGGGAPGMEHGAILGRHVLGIKNILHTDGQPGFNHFGLWVEDKARFCRRLAAEGVEVIEAPYKDRFVYFIKDPDGNRIEIFET